MPPWLLLAVALHFSSQCLWNLFAYLEFTLLVCVMTLAVTQAI